MLSILWCFAVYLFIVFPEINYNLTNNNLTINESNTFINYNSLLFDNKNYI